MKNKITKEELYESIRKLKRTKLIDGSVAMQLNRMVFHKFEKEIMEQLSLGYKEQNNIKESMND